MNLRDMNRVNGVSNGVRHLFPLPPLPTLFLLYLRIFFFSSSLIYISPISSLFKLTLKRKREKKNRKLQYSSQNFKNSSYSSLLLLKKKKKIKKNNNFDRGYTFPDRELKSWSTRSKKFPCRGEGDRG